MQMKIIYVLVLYVEQVWIKQAFEHLIEKYLCFHSNIVRFDGQVCWLFISIFLHIYTLYKSSHNSEYNWKFQDFFFWFWAKDISSGEIKAVTIPSDQWYRWLYLNLQINKQERCKFNSVKGMRYYQISYQCIVVDRSVMVTLRYDLTLFGIWLFGICKHGCPPVVVSVPGGSRGGRLSKKKARRYRRAACIVATRPTTSRTNASIRSTQGVRETLLRRCCYRLPNALLYLQPVLYVVPLGRMVLGMWRHICPHNQRIY